MPICTSRPFALNARMRITLKRKDQRVGVLLGPEGRRVPEFPPRREVAKGDQERAVVQVPALDPALKAAQAAVEGV